MVEEQSSNFRADRHPLSRPEEAPDRSARRASGLVTATTMAFDFANFQDAGATDPTSDFLQREKQAAGSLLGDDAALFGGKAPPATEHDFERRAHDFPALDDDGQFQDAVSENQSATPDPSVKQFHAFPPADEIDGHADLAAWNDTVPAAAPEPIAEPEAAAEQPTENLAATEPVESMPAPAPAPELAPAAPEPPKKTPFTYDDLDVETEPLRAWREAQEDGIAKREAAAERQRAEAVSKAEQEIDQFYADYNAQKEKSIKKNKESEARFREQKQQELAEGTTWTRITKLLDLQNSQSKTIAKGGPGSTDLSRMKDLYLSLRREGDAAPGAAGY